MTTIRYLDNGPVILDEAARSSLNPVEDFNCQM
jgi:hypothetical protein